MTSHKLQPVERVNEGLCNTNSGILFNLLNPTPEMFIIEDMVTGVCNECRWGKQIPEFYSVGQHTLLVWFLASEHLKPAALLHDMPEGMFLGDAIKPWKIILGKAYTDIEDLYQSIIFKKYGVDLDLLKELKYFDNLATEIEFNYFKRGNLDFIGIFYKINELLGYKPVKQQLLTLMRSEFLEHELTFNP